MCVWSLHFQSILALVPALFFLALVPALSKTFGFSPSVNSRLKKKSKTNGGTLKHKNIQKKLLIFNSLFFLSKNIISLCTFNSSLYWSLHFGIGP